MDGSGWLGARNCFRCLNVPSKKTKQYTSQGVQWEEPTPRPKTTPQTGGAGSGGGKLPPPRRTGYYEEEPPSRWGGGGGAYDTGEGYYTPRSLNPISKRVAKDDSNRPFIVPFDQKPKTRPFGQTQRYLDDYEQLRFDESGPSLNKEDK